MGYAAGTVAGSGVSGTSSGGDPGGLVELGIDGRPSLFILESIGEYDPESGESAKCKFLKY